MSTLHTFQKLELIRSTANLAASGNTTLAATFLCDRVTCVEEADSILDSVARYTNNTTLTSMRQLVHIILE